MYELYLHMCNVHGIYRIQSPVTMLRILGTSCENAKKISALQQHMILYLDLSQDVNDILRQGLYIWSKEEINNYEIFSHPCDHLTKYQ